MRTTQLVTSYASAALFAALAGSVFLIWRRARESRSAHLMVATALRAAQALVSAVSATLYNTLAGEAAPRWLSSSSTILTYIAIYAFLLFLFDFITVPSWVHGILLIGNATFIVFAIIERFSIRLTDKGFVATASPFAFRPYLYAVVAWILLLTGILWLSFAVYGLRARGLVRFRMLSIGAGFLLFFVVVGLIPLLLLQTSAASIKNTLIVLLYVALASVPLLYLGFAPPRWLMRRLPEPGEAPAV